MPRIEERRVAPVDAHPRAGTKSYGDVCLGHCIHLLQDAIRGRFFPSTSKSPAALRGGRRIVCGCGLGGDEAVRAHEGWLLTRNHRRHPDGNEPVRSDVGQAAIARARSSGETRASSGETGSRSGVITPQATPAQFPCAGDHRRRMSSMSYPAGATIHEQTNRLTWTPVRRRRTSATRCARAKGTHRSRMRSMSAGCRKRRMSQEKGAPERSLPAPLRRRVTSGRT
jgi:hypothetical protein